MGYGAAPSVCNGTNSEYNQHCAVWNWYNEYNDFMKGRCDSWKDISGIGHFTAMIWKGIDKIGCAKSGNYYVCQYGHTNCMAEDPTGGSYGGLQCFDGVPSRIANFNIGLCPEDGTCVGCRDDELESDAQARVEQCGAGPVEDTLWERSQEVPSTAAAAANTLNVLLATYVLLFIQILPDHPFAV